MSSYKEYFIPRDTKEINQLYVQYHHTNHHISEACNNIRDIYLRLVIGKSTIEIIEQDLKLLPSLQILGANLKKLDIFTAWLLYNLPKLFEQNIQRLQIQFNQVDLGFKVLDERLDEVKTLLQEENHLENKAQLFMLDYTLKRQLEYSRQELAQASPDSEDKHFIRAVIGGQESTSASPYKLSHSLTSLGQDLDNEIKASHQGHYIPQEKIRKTLANMQNFAQEVISIRPRHSGLERFTNAIISFFISFFGVKDCEFNAKRTAKTLQGSTVTLLNKQSIFNTFKKPEPINQRTMPMDISTFDDEESVSDDNDYTPSSYYSFG